MFTTIANSLGGEHLGQRQGVAPAAASGLGPWLVTETLDGGATDLRRICDDIRILISLWPLLYYCFSSYHSLRN